MKRNKVLQLLLLAVMSIYTGCGVRDNTALMELAQSDQRDRRENNPNTDKNDVDRLKEVKKIIKAKSLGTSNDYFNAAIVLQHGQGSEDFMIANELAKKAVQLDSSNREAKILIAQSMDRYLRSINQPQIYGTQRRTLGLSELQYLQPIDTAQVSDTERKELGIRTIQESLNYFNKMHHRNESDLLAYVASDSLIKAHEIGVQAELIGTFDALLSKIIYPKAALENSISGKVLVQFTITEEGNIKDIFVVDGIGFGCDEEAKRIISLAKYKNYMGRAIERRTKIPFKIEH